MPIFYMLQHREVCIDFKNTNKIPQDFSAWELLGSNFGLPVREFKNIVNHYNHIYAASNDALFKLNDQGTFENLYSDSKYKIQYISAEKQNMYIGLTCFNNCNNKILKWEEDDIYTTIENDCTQKICMSQKIVKGIFGWQMSDGDLGL